MFLPNAYSFVLIRSAISKPIIQSDVQGSATSLPSSLSSDFRRNLFLSNSHTFLLSKSRISKPAIQSDIHPVRDVSPHGGRSHAIGEAISNGIQESATNLPPPSSPDLPPPSSPDLPPPSSSNPGRNIFLPNSHSFLLTRSAISKPVVQSTIAESATSLPPLSSPDSDKPIVGDKNKRIFLKMASIAGVSVISSLILPKKADALIMGSSPTTGVVGVKNATNARINPATEETLDEVLKTSDLSLTAGVLDVKVTSLPGAGSSSFSDSENVDKKGLVDADRHVQVDVVSSALPSTASTETTLQTISFGGFKFTLRMAVKSDDANIDYVGEAAIGTLTSAASWRIKKVDSTTGVIIQWAGTGVFDQIWDNREALSYT